MNSNNREDKVWPKHLFKKYNILMIQYYMVRVKTEEERCERILVPLRWIAKLKKIQFPISSFIVLIQGLCRPAPTHLASPKIDPATMFPQKVPSFLFLQQQLPA